MKRYSHLSLLAAAFITVVGAAAPTFAGRMPVPGIDEDKFVGAHQTVTYRSEWFRGGELALITATGDGSSDLDLYVYDQYGHLIVSDTDATDQCVVSFTPIWSGPFTIKVVNQGNVSNMFTLHTN